MPTMTLSPAPRQFARTMKPSGMVFYGSGPSASTARRPEAMVYRGGDGGAQIMGGAAKLLRGAGTSRGMGQVVDAATSTVRRLWQEPFVRFALVMAIGYAIVRPRWRLR